jgi:hypothetical protein
MKTKRWHAPSGANNGNTDVVMGNPDVRLGRPRVPTGSRGAAQIALTEGTSTKVV